MPKRLVSAHELTDEEVLKEFVRRFKCDGAVLVYFDEGTEQWFGRWRNTKGRRWVNTFFQHIERDTKKTIPKSLTDEGITISFPQ